MTRIEGPAHVQELPFGWLRAPMFSGETVGDRLVPSPIEVDFPGGDGQPSLFGVIEVIDGVPRWTELTLRRTEGGREIRERDLRAIELDNWLEAFVASMSGQIRQRDDGVIEAVYRSNEASVREGMKAIRNIRKGSRRPMTADRLSRVAEAYNAQETGGIEAVEVAFTVSRSTAIRYINAARDAGLIERRQA